MDEDAGYLVAEPARDVPSRLAGVRWGPIDIVLGVVIALIAFFLLSLVVVGPFVAEYGEAGEETLAAQAVAVALWDVALVVLVLWLIRRRHSSLADLNLAPPGGSARPIWDFGRLMGRGSPPVEMGQGGAGPGYFINSVLSGYVTSYLLVVIYSAIVVLLGLEFLEPAQQVQEDVFESSLLVVLYGIAIVLAAPVAEEVFFRGFFFAGLRRSLPFLPAAAISGGVFSLAHADPGFFIPFTLVGMVLAYLYERSGSLLTSITMHFLFNGVSFVVMLLVPDVR